MLSAVEDAGAEGSSVQEKGGAPLRTTMVLMEPFVGGQSAVKRHWYSAIEDSVVS